MRPTHSAASSTPICASDSAYSSRSVGTSTGSPIASAEKLAWCERAGGEDRPPVPRPRYSPKGLIGRAPVETTTLFVSR